VSDKHCFKRLGIYFTTERLATAIYKDEITEPGSSSCTMHDARILADMMLKAMHPHSVMDDVQDRVARARAALGYQDYGGVATELMEADELLS